MAVPPMLENFNVSFGPPGGRSGARRPVVTLPAGDRAYGVQFTVEGDWTAADAGTWELGLRVTDSDGSVVPVSDSEEWYEQYSFPVDFSEGQRFHDQTVFLVALSRTATLLFERLLEAEVVGSAKIAIEVKRDPQ